MTDWRKVPPTALPHLLAGLHSELDVGDRRNVRLPPRLLEQRRTDIATGAGFKIVRGLTTSVTTVEAFWTLPDSVAAGMQLLVCGLNPSPASADAGVAFARPGNRFWPAAIAAGIVTSDRDPERALASHGMGMTDIVKRTTRRADELAAGEYQQGIARLKRLAAWLRPRRICFVGLAGWRAAVDRKAIAGWQPVRLAEVPVYVMPSTSGLNASSQLPDLADHLRAAAKDPQPKRDERHSPPT